ncbi:hypothetical protein A5766_04375 [Gordonia sp. 852002-51296_SCH5728562-b]|nr:hypothetical protein A5766_04375 [Gordonia sp. 852002-51296_SCH5728562-b]
MIAAIIVAIVAATIVACTSSGSGSGDGSGTAPPGASSGQASTPARSSVASAPSASRAPAPPVEGAYAGAGGPRPATAEPLPTYVGRYTHLRSAHLLTPTGGIGCDFNEPDANGKQGQCGVTSFNTSNSPLGCVNRVGTCKGKWLFGFADNRVGEPYDSSGTTGWMNQPASDGYQVPRVQYGHQYYFDDWAIASEFNGLTVWNTTTGSGVFLSKQKSERFEGPGTSAPTAGGEAIALGAPQSGGAGYGSVEPRDIDLGGASSTSQMKNITWTDWGSDRATGTGIGNYQPPDKSGIYRESGVAGNVVAFDPGTCGGKRAYTKIAYFFPSKGERFDAANAIDICTSR